MTTLRPLSLAIFLTAGLAATAYGQEHEPSSDAKPAIDWSWLANLDIDLYGNFLGRKDDKPVVDDDGERIDDRIFLRQVDLDFRTSLTDRADLALILSLQADPVTSYEAQIEEGWFRFNNLPFLDDTDWNFAFKGGRFRPVFGHGNRYRTFELPQPTRPMALEQFLGENGFVQNGFSFEFGWEPSERHAAKFTVERVNNGDLPVAETEGEEAFADLLNLTVNSQVGPVHIQAGGSKYRGKQDGSVGRRSDLRGLDLALTVNPCEEADESFLGALFLGGEYFEADIDRDGAPEDRPNGWYAWGGAQLGSEWFVTGRLERVQELDDESLESVLWGLYVTWVYNADLRLTMGWQETESDVDEMDGLRTLLFEANFALGRSPERPFWLRSSSAGY